VAVGDGERRQDGPLLPFDRLDFDFRVAGKGKLVRPRFRALDFHLGPMLCFFKYLISTWERCYDFYKYFRRKN
jgi:hypothetical protein